MLQKTMTFEDLDGNPVTETFYFNVSKAEVAEMELSKTGGMSEWLKRVIAAENGAEIVATFKEIIMMSVGKRSEDGRRFIKTQEIRDDFAQTDAYSQLFMELVTNPVAGAEFIRGIMPKDLAEALDKSEAANNLQLPAGDDVAVPRWMLEDREPTTKELAEMSKDELQAAFTRRAKRQAASASQ